MFLKNLQIINQSLIKKNTITSALMAYNESINQVTKFIPKKVLYGKTDTSSSFEVNKCYEDCLNQHKDNLKIIPDVIKTRIENEKC